ncbi:sensor histidine kinase [Microbacterium bovistercoris]|uniref:histidine kinase n=1 Tax=Microbacterium bovistercoris TaxID=2293570 RepID=A0A371NVP3_9MICO|nr:ATP-binding protein [Microbacterium bovistercoris]REJ05870.1 sensor histidine kinase [Microbacterium bovistercoris]
MDDPAPSPSTDTPLPRAIVRGAAGALWGVALLPAVLFAVLAAPVHPATTIARWTARRLSWIDGAPRESLPRGGRLFGMHAVMLLLGILNLCVLALLVIGVVSVVQVVTAAATGSGVSVFDAPPGRVTWSTVAVFALPGIVMLFLAASGIGGILWLERRAWSSFARPGAEQLEREITRLSSTLDDVVAAVDGERRRIERDIHDGVQQRVVALSILLARAERAEDAAARDDLLRRGVAETRLVLEDLRTVAWRTYPAMLARDGLLAALEALRDRTPLPIRLDAEVSGARHQAAETAAYFVASEAVTNAIKHGECSSIEIWVRDDGDELTIAVLDDGIGGADASGPGLTGIASRVRAQDGRLRVDSPAGGPTRIEAVLPCA